MSEAYTLMHIPVRLVEAVQGVVSGLTVTLTPAEASTLASLRAGTHVVVAVEILDRFPEINPSNYNDEDVCALNNWGVEVVLAAAPEAADG